MIPKEQRQRPIAIHLWGKFEAHIDELIVGGVIEEFLEPKDILQITHFTMPTLYELRNIFAGSDRFSSLYMNHA